MGTRGPVPKRSDQRRRQNKEGGEVERVKVDGLTVEAPELAADDLEPLAVAWYRSLAESGQSRFYEPSDWFTAQLIARAISEFCRKPSAMMLSSLLSGASSLLVTEGDRRRLRLELERDSDESAEVTSLDDLRARLSG